MVFSVVMGWKEFVALDPFTYISPTCLSCKENSSPPKRHMTHRPLQRQPPPMSCG
jgi:hypothetical protein